MSKYQPKKGTEDYVHVEVTEKNGQKLAQPVVEQYHPNVWPSVSKLAGFKGSVVHEPRTAEEQQEDAPSASSVKSTSQLVTLEDYRARYTELFKEEAPFNITFDDLKVLVDRAERKLAEAPTDGKVSADGEPGQGEGDKLPVNKADWFKLFQEMFPEDETKYEDITVAVIREKLGK